jgi:DNA polymerase III sliding clamp (beta) subunit (PCNA family)
VKVRIEAALLDEALTAVGPAVPPPGTAYAALHGVRLVAAGPGILVESSNLDLTITHAVPCDVVGSGVFLAPHALLAAVAGRMDGPVELTGEDGLLRVRAGNRTAELAGVSDAGWPRFLPLAGESAILAPRDWATITRLRPFARTDGTQPVLGCVRLIDGLAVATDSYRLAAHPVSVGMDARLPVALIDAAGPAAAPLVLLNGALAVELTSGSTVWRAATAEGEHLAVPAVQALTRWGVADPIGATVDRAGLLDTRAVAAVGGDVVELAVVDGGIELANGTDRVATRATLDAATAGAVEMRLNGRYLREVLAGGHGGDVTLTFAGASLPCRVIDGDLVAVVMPIR